MSNSSRKLNPVIWVTYKASPTLGQKGVYVLVRNLACQWGKNSWQCVWDALGMRIRRTVRVILWRKFWNVQILCVSYDLSRRNYCATFVNISWTISKLGATIEWQGVPASAVAWTFWNSCHGLTRTTTIGPIPTHPTHTVTCSSVIGTQIAWQA